MLNGKSFKTRDIINFMKTKNIRSLESLGFFCHLCGLGCIVLGLLVVFMDIMNRNVMNIQIGILIVAIGYAFVKIAFKINLILNEEKRTETSSQDTWSPV